jgi:hypothetical protein
LVKTFSYSWSSLARACSAMPHQSPTDKHGWAFSPLLVLHSPLLVLRDGICEKVQQQAS